MRLRFLFQRLRGVIRRPGATSLAGLAALLAFCLYIYLLATLVWSDTVQIAASSTATPSSETEAARTPFSTPISRASATNPATSPTATLTYMPISYTPTPAHLVYVVEAGDTLSGIARRFNTTVNAIMELNSLSSELLSIGQELFIPGRRQAATSSPTLTPSSTSIWAILSRLCIVK